MPLLFTVAEACQLLDPKLEPAQLKAIINALRWEPAAWLSQGRPGHPWPAYPWDQISALHHALLPFLPQ